jgi:hypothetical protein
MDQLQALYMKQPCAPFLFISLDREGQKETAPGEGELS